MTTAMPRTAKGAQTLQRLLQAAKVVFERDGFLTARVSDIAKEAGVSHGAFYHYFQSKEQIFRVVAEQQEVTLLTLDPAAGTEKDPIRRIEAANRRYLEAYRAEAGIMRVIEEVSRYDEEIRAVRERHDVEFALRVEASIRQLQEAGLADSRVDPWYAANALGCMVARFAELFIQGGDFTLAKAVRQLTLLWANALGLKA